MRVTIAGREYEAADKIRARLEEIAAEYPGRAFPEDAEAEWDTLNAALDREQQRNERLRELARFVLDEEPRRIRLGGLYREDVPLAALVDRYLHQHQADPATLRKLRSDLRQAVRAFGDVPLDQLVPAELATWRASLSPGPVTASSARSSRCSGRPWTGGCERNPADGIRNPKPHRPEVETFASWDDVDAVAVELGPRYGAVAIFAAGTGPRPEEGIALERRDLDREKRVVAVERVYSHGALKAPKKSSRQLRRVPLRRRSSAPSRGTTALAPSGPSSVVWAPSGHRPRLDHRASAHQSADAGERTRTSRGLRPTGPKPVASTSSATPAGVRNDSPRVDGPSWQGCWNASAGRSATRAGSPRASIRASSSRP